MLRYSGFPEPLFSTSEKEYKLWNLERMERVVYTDIRDLENLVASHLLKYCNFIQDTEGEKMSLHFLRDRDGREIDFVVCKNKKPLFAVECKLGERQLSKHIGYFKERTPIPKFFQVHMGQDDHGNENTSGRTLPFWTFCKELELM